MTQNTMTRKEFVKNLFEKEEADEIREIVRVIKLLKSEQEEGNFYTTTFGTT